MFIFGKLDEMESIKHVLSALMDSEVLVSDTTGCTLKGRIANCIDQIDQSDEVLLYQSADMKDEDKYLLDFIVRYSKYVGKKVSSYVPYKTDQRQVCHGCSTCFDRSRKIDWFPLSIFQA